MAFSLVVSDGIATSADDTVVVTVSVPGAPVANAGLDAAAVTGATVHLTERAPRTVGTSIELRVDPAIRHLR